MLNKFSIMGYLTRDIELKYTTNGTAIGLSAIASTHYYKVNNEKKEDTCFIDVTIFGKTVEIAYQYLKKGSRVYFDGRLKFQHWTDDNGKNRSKHSLLVEKMILIGEKGDFKLQDQQETNQVPAEVEEYKTIE